VGDRGFNAGGWAYMKRVKCPRCGWSFLIGNRNPRKTCANKAKCDARRAKKKRREQW
jgi:ribosomal protein S27AE